MRPDPKLCTAQLLTAVVAVCAVCTAVAVFGWSQALPPGSEISGSRYAFDFTNTFALVVLAAALVAFGWWKRWTSSGVLMAQGRLTLRNGLVTDLDVPLGEIAAIVVENLVNSRRYLGPGWRPQAGDPKAWQAPVVVMTDGTRVTCDALASPRGEHGTRSSAETKADLMRRYLRAHPAA